MSNNSVRHSIMGRFQQNLKNKQPKLPLSVQKAFPINQEVAKVILRVPAALQNRISEAEVASTFDAMGLRYLPNSFVRCHAKDQELFSGVVTSKRQIMTEETASSVGLEEVASNVFTDSADNVWDRHVVDGKPVFVCTAGDDVEELLKNYKETANVSPASLEVAAATSFNGGDVVAFYDIAKETASTGIATGEGNNVYLPGEDKVQEVPGTMVLAAASGWQGVSFGKEEVLEYFRKLYGQNTEFYNKLRDLVNSYLTV